MPGSHVCPVCGRSYTADRNLKRHMRDVHSAIYGNYRCPVCGRGFNKKAQFKKHVATRHGQPGAAPAPPLPTSAPPPPPPPAPTPPTPAPSPPEPESPEGNQTSAGYPRRPLPKMPQGFKPFKGGHFITRRGRDGVRKSIFIPNTEGRRGLVVIRGEKDSKPPNIPTDTTPHPPKEEQLTKPGEFDKITLARFDREHPVPDSGPVGLKMVNGKNGPEWVDTGQNLVYWKHIEEYAPYSLKTLKDTDIPKYYVDMPLRDAPKGLVYELRQAFAMNRDAVCNNQMPVNVMLQGQPGCLTAEALICTEDGQLVRIGELINPMRSVGIYIVDLPVFPPARANALHLYDVYNTVEITTKSGRRVRVTPNHPLMTPDGWLEASNIKAGERLRIYSKLPSPQKYVPVIISLSERARLATRSPDVKMPEYFSPELGEYVGIWVAEGHAEIGRNTKRIGFAISQDEEELTNRIVELTKSLFNVEAVVNDWKPVETKPGYFTKTRQIRVRYAEVADFFFPMWRSSRGDEPKNVPTPILLSPKSVSAAFLRGLFEGDGSVYFHKGVEKKRNNYRVALKSASRQLCEEVQILLLRHGIYSSIYQGTNFRLGKTHDSYILVIRRKQNLELFRDEIGFISTMKRERLNICIQSCSRYVSDPDSDYEEVISVNPMEEWTRVYDLEVPETHAFVANGILSHNTGKTVAVEAAAHDLGLPLHYFSASSDVAGKAQLLGRLAQKKDGRWVWRDGLITQAARYGGILCIDEFSLLDPEVQSALHALLDKKRILDLSAYNGEVVKVHPDCFVVACMNPAELGTLGVREVTEPIRRRFNFIMVDYPAMKTELGMLQKQAGLSSSDLTIPSYPERTVCGGRYGAPITAFERTIDEVRKMVMKNEGDVKFMPTASEAVMFTRYLQRGRDQEDAARLALLGKYVGDSRKQVEAVWMKKRVEAQAQVKP